MTLEEDLLEYMQFKFDRTVIEMSELKNSMSFAISDSKDYYRLMYYQCFLDCYSVVFNDIRKIIIAHQHNNKK